MIRYFKKLINNVGGVNTLILEDLKVWAYMNGLKMSFWAFLFLFFKYPEYRGLVDYRLKSSKLFIPLRIIIYFSYKSHNLWLISKHGIEGGLFLQHGFSTIVFCESMGNNCFINQQVTIGYDGSSGIPTIGSNVRVSCGAKVLGKITIGDDVYIGANAVVVKDVPSHSMVVGVPAKIIKKRDNINEKWKKI